MNIVSFLKDKILLFCLHTACMMALFLFLCATGYPEDAALLVLVCWFLILSVWGICEYRKRKRYFAWMEEMLAQVDKRFLLGELMPSSGRLEDKLYREMIRASNRSVIEKIHAAEEAKQDYREYIESLVHEIKAPVTGIALICGNHKSDITRRIGSENAKIENLVDMALYYARSDEVYKDYFIRETDLGEAAAEAVARNKYYFIQNNMQVRIDCKDRVYTEKKERGVLLMVEDNGAGIKKEELSRIFEKNFTGSNGREQRRSTGMGLYLCGKLCAKLGIGIRAESEENVFTKIILEFPISAYLSKL